MVPTAMDEINGPVPVTCDPSPGAVFPIGTTLVTCSAEDASLNPGSVSFSVTVNPLPLPEPAPPV